MGKRLEIHLMLLAALTVSVFSQTIRLVSPLDNGVGRLEVYYNGTWGTVCDDDFGADEAKVACRQLGRYQSGHTPRAIQTFGFGGGQIWLDDVSCSGSESSLASCSHRSWGVNNCGHSEDVGIICDPSDITMRLTPNYKRGLLQVLHSSIWGTVCDHDFGQVEASVVCRALGYQGGKDIDEASPIKMWLDDVDCTLLNTDLKDCKHSPWGVDNCNDSEAVGVECFSFPEEATAARLVSSTTNMPGDGVLELYYKGQWGRVYYSGFGVEEATVACRMLGYNTITAKASSSSNTGSESRRVIVEKFHCLGTELSLNDCLHYPWGSVTSSSTVVRIQCPNANLQIRLNSTTRGLGRVEVLHNNVWGTVCRGSSFSSEEAQVVCKMANLPWTTASVTTSYAAGEGLIWLSNVDCTGTETSLDECSHSGWGTAPGCSHSSDVGVVCRGASRSVHLEPPGSVLNVFLGQPISVKCVVDNSSTPVTSFRWTHSGRSYSGQTFTTTITSKSDSGTLTCNAQNMMASTQINVWYPPEVHLEPGNDTIDVGVGDNLHVQCVADDANPTTYTFRWSHNGKTSTEETILIQNVTKADSGRLSCTVDNGHMMTPGRADATINVKYPPEIHLSTRQDVISVMVGDVVDVECVVDDANPAVSSYMWRHNGDISYGQTFLKHASSSDSGNISCFATNEQGTSSVQTSIEVLQASSLIGNNDITSTNKVIVIATGSVGIVIIIILIIIIIYQRRRMQTATHDNKPEENPQRPGQASRADGARRRQNYENMERPSGGAENTYCEIPMTPRRDADPARAFDNHGYDPEERIRQATEKKQSKVKSPKRRKRNDEPVYQNAIARKELFS
ncbi:deleted in malignant brain tumors 1 protein-like [Haliotis rubra]|uniref:deleted in malignant brain tumors 1 protein-like n=1 Tax=Haliotis rubra TaxID=36100 RepID=UPI001EE60D55|nr:deleted in malignant brain tumors 1 protein-like [Haliotis rubra]